MAEEALVALDSCESYECDRVYSILKKQLGLLGISKDEIAGKRVVIKPNLVRKMDAGMAGTTHPSFVEAAGRLLVEMGAGSVKVAESPGGPYNEIALRSVYKGCGIESAAKAANIQLNYDISWKYRENPSGEISKCFNIIDPYNDCDIIVNLCKLKSHGMAMMSAAVKNYFGTVPGVEKFEMHARFPNMSDFSRMLVDLCKMHTESCLTINIVDAVVGMEGNGPTNGVPKKIGAILASINPFALDYVCTRLIGFENKVETVTISEKRGYFDKDSIKILGSDVEALKCGDFKGPDSERVPALIWLSDLMGGRILGLIEPKPVINTKKCKRCGECVRSCPKHTIVFDKKKKFPKIHHSECIKCFCCQELCPHDAVKIKQNPLVKLLH